MSKEYTLKLTEEIDLYIENLHKFQNFDISPLEEEYQKYIDRVNTLLYDEAAEVLKTLEQKQESYNDFSKLQTEAQKELVALEDKLKLLEYNDEPIKKKINSLKSKIKKAKAELDENNQLARDPLYRLFGHKAKADSKIAELTSVIKNYNDEISALELQKSDPDKIKTIKSRISSVKSRIDNLKAEKNNVITIDGHVLQLEQRLEGVCAWFTNEYSRQRNIWLGNSEPYRDDLYSPTILHEYKRCIGRVDLSNVSGYELMNYKNLFEILYAIPGTVNSNKIKLDEKFSALCQQKFAYLREACPKNYGEKATWQNACKSKLKNTFTNIVFPIAPKEINNTKFENMIYKEVAVKSTPENGNYYDLVAEFIQTNKEATISEIRNHFKLGNGLLIKILDELKQKGVIDNFDFSDTNSTIRYIADNPESVATVKECLLKDYFLERYLEAKQGVSENLIKGFYINEDFLLKLKEMLVKNPEIDLPDIIINLREDEMDYYEIASELLSFRNLYRETDEQILKTNQQFFAEQEIKQLEENARKEREMYERQAELNREAENERARMLAAAERDRAEAERERAAAEDRRTASMAAQAELSRRAAEDRLREERIEEQSRRYRADAEAERSKYDAIFRCKNCAHFSSCVLNKTNPSCPTYLPKRSNH